MDRSRPLRVHFRPLRVHFCPLPSTSVHFCRLPSTSVHFLVLSNLNKGFQEFPYNELLHMSDPLRDEKYLKSKIMAAAGAVNREFIYPYSNWPTCLTRCANERARPGPGGARATHRSARVAASRPESPRVAPSHSTEPRRVAPEAARGPPRGLPG